MESTARENRFLEVESWFSVRSVNGKHSEAGAAFQGRPSKKSFAKLPRGTNARGVMGPYSYLFCQDYGQLNTSSVCF